MVVLLTALVRWGFSLQALITREHFNVMAKVMLMASHRHGAVLRSPNGSPPGITASAPSAGWSRSSSPAPMRRSTGACCCSTAWCRSSTGRSRIRNSVVAVVVIAILINVGMWLERIEIVWNTLSHGYLPSMWRVFFPTIWDWALLAGSLGFFAFLYLILVRVFPMVSMHEVRRLVYEGGKAS